MIPSLFRHCAAWRHGLIVAGVLWLLSCGGDGAPDLERGNRKPGSFAPSEQFAHRCVAPRPGINPATGAPFDDIAGTRLDENNWLRSWSHELYLWYDEIVDRDPSRYDTLDYFDLLKTEELTASGRQKDRFHFTYPSADWFSLSQSGVSAGYGAQWVITAEHPPRELVVAYTEPDSPATSASVNLARGVKVLSVDGVDLTYSDDVDTLNAGLFPSRAGETHSFVVQDRGTDSMRSITMTSANIQSAPVQNIDTITTATGNVGYMVFNDHIAIAEAKLPDAIAQFVNDGVVDLVLDLRYNGGGYLDIASQLAYMIAGPSTTDGEVFEAMQFNDQHTTTNPVTGQPLAPTPFHSTTLGLALPSGLGLPTLNLSRVFVISGSNTCSASEAIINGLRGVGVEVIQIGSTTCGKPYGFYPADNCGTTYFSIQFRGVNARGLGDYADGFSPANTSDLAGERIPGCEVADDFTRALGDTSEDRLAAALVYRDSERCPADVQSKSTGGTEKRPPASDGSMRKPPFLLNRIMRATP